MFTYQHPHPAVAADIAVFTLRGGGLSVLLIQRKLDPYRGKWALPGGFLGPDETLEEAAARELREETGVAGVEAIQFGIYSRPDRDPRERVISVAHFACVAFDKVAPAAGSDAANVRWASMSDLPPLAFDHATILQDALAALRASSRDRPTVARLLPSPFRISDLQAATETVLGVPMDKRNFRRQIDDRGWLEATNVTDRGRHRPAQLFKLKESER
jgi:8-oxo-dGTP diphosphatase